MATAAAPLALRLESIYNHLVLPARLPAQQDANLKQIGYDLLDRLIRATSTLANLPANQFSQSYGLLHRSLQTCKVVNEGGKLDRISLLTAFRTLECNGVLILYITEQNTGLTVRRENDSAEDDRVVFEAFEASPLSEHVLAANTLAWDFPGCAVAVPYETFRDESFQSELSGFLERASTESIKTFAAQSYKERATISESRDTVDPGLTTHILMPLLEVIGTRVYPTILRKRVRDDVCWTDGAEKPWRRCPFWLVLRVAVQRHLSTLLGGELGRLQYKFLVCLVLAQFLEDSTAHLDLELSLFLNAKLCRRIAKLEVDKNRVPLQICQAYEKMFTLLGSLFLEKTRSATDLIKNTWTRFKIETTRRIGKLPRHAAQARGLTWGDPPLFLSLPNSRGYLNRVLSEARRVNVLTTTGTSKLPPDFDPSLAMPTAMKEYMEKYRVLSDKECEIENDFREVPESISSCKARCIELAEAMSSYIALVANAYDGIPEQKSTMLLVLMEMWMSMDKCAIKVFSLLRDYDSGFPPNILDVLQLSKLSDMQRLQRIRVYLQHRYTECKSSHMTIFHDPGKGCFAERYYNESPESSNLKALHERIENAAEAKRQERERVWKRMTAEFKDLKQQVAESSCVYYTDEFLVRIHDASRCRRCFLDRRADRMKIDIHEHPLPSNLIQAKSVVFELGCPDAFLKYREATWTLIGVFGGPSLLASQAERTLLTDYPELTKHLNQAQLVQRKEYRICLASTKKSHLGTHYSKSHFTVKENDMFRPHGMEYGYFDNKLEVWPSRVHFTPTFAHHCELELPQSSPLSSIVSSMKLSINSNGPTSYQVIANQTKCPTGLNVHEFMGYISLFSGKVRRWPQILNELGSSNLNFSSETTTLLISSLALQVGPSAGEEEHPGVIHKILRDEFFCNRLLEQLRWRLESISSNWRETHCMETIITLLLRLAELGNVFDQKASELLQDAREVTLTWIAALRQEAQSARDVEASQRCSKYALWAGLLCRRTFALYVDSSRVPDAAALQTFLECSVALQDNMPNDPVGLTGILKCAVIRDVKMVSRLKGILRQSVDKYPTTLIPCISTIWPNIQHDPTRKFNIPKFLSGSNDCWIEIKIEFPTYNAVQFIHIHLLEGHFLVMGQPIGRLSAVYRESVTLNALFENHSLLTYPSHLPGMSHMLTVSPNDHQIHVGLRDGKVFIRALLRDTMLEFIPPEIFHSRTNFDIPFSLIDNCIHWLDLKTGILEIRQKPNIWHSKPSNWKLNVNTRKAQRRTVTLINPQSKIFQAIANIFRNFEHPQYITVFQPEFRPLSVELRRLELSFTVNGRGWLESSQLRAEINDNQDAGTWYGLYSKLVLTEVMGDPQTKQHIVPRHPRRSIIVPMGELRYKRNGPHVTVWADNDAAYGIFTINNILRRLDCQAEPRLLYLKAQYHAYTSFVIPDPLTGRTGTEEALHFLSSGICQPWSPLNEGQNRGLQWLAKLTPRREYYPKHLKVMQKTLWDPNLTTNIQHDCYRTFVDTIHKRSEELATFALQKYQLPRLDQAGEHHLTERSQLRRQIYQRSNAGFLNPSQIDWHQTLKYPARHFQRATPVRKNVLEIVSLIRSWPSKFATTSNLAGMLHGHQTIGGFTQGYNSVLLSDLLNLDLSTNWGPLVKLCCGLGYEDRYQLIFLFAVMAFSHKDPEELMLLRTLLAFAVFADLKELDKPIWLAYNNFQNSEVPTSGNMSVLIEPSLIPYPGDDRSTAEFNLTAKFRKKLENEERDYLQRQRIEGKTLIDFLLTQWPCQEPSFEGLPDMLLVKITHAIDAVLPEWHRLYQNCQLSTHFADVQKVLDAHTRESQPSASAFEIREQEVFPMRIRGGEVPHLLDLLQKGCHLAASKSENVETSSISISDCQVNGISSTTLDHIQQVAASDIVPIESPEIKEIQTIVGVLVKSKLSVRRQYGQDLYQSLEAFRRMQGTFTRQQIQVSEAANLVSQIPQAQLGFEDDLNQLKVAFEGQDTKASAVQWLQQGYLWPCITPVTLLENLRSTTNVVFGKGMKESLVSYGISITSLQRLFRMESAYQIRNKQRFREEYQNVGHTNWQPLRRTDWLLLEIDANLLIRPGQIEVALATIHPSSNSNSVLQMNMGQGKTSCIMPMAAAVLADGKRLMRVIVPKPLLLQTAQLMHARLGGLLGRKIVHVPFSRKTKTDLNILNKFDTIHQKVRTDSGVVLALPEHILSFKLSGQQQLSDGHVQEAKRMIQIQEWISQVSRDVIDEADSIVAIRTQLIYPSGTQKTVDGHPQRWLVAEALLRLVRGHLWNLHHNFPQSIEVVQRGYGGLPFVFFLRKDVEDRLLSLLVEDIYLGRTSILPAEIPKSDRLLIKQFISEPRVPSTLATSIEKMFPDKPSLKQVTYLLRGLIVHRILIMALKKRWNVQYGLHPERDPMAVPFTAKGTPSEQAEWGHPDVAILFTCLAFYYQGLSYAQLRQTLEHVLKSDDPSQIYERFSENSTLPDSLRMWNAINVDDEVQLQELWVHLHASVIVIDYFLNNHVFPRYAKQFHMKLQASGWDIPLFSAEIKSEPALEVQSSKASAALTTGFSGTNDWKRMLPLTITQNDLRGLSHTNAEVLAYLLQPRNRGYILAADNRGRHLSEHELLRCIKTFKIRILIDAGAQILEMNNRDLVKAWLEIDTEAQAAVYFDDSNKACVYYRRGTSIPLLASTFADDLSECLVYLDEAHTRGTDLKLPPRALGALTLGLGQTKDHTVQAAMRLRQLGTTQSVLFFAPPEVNQSILDLRMKKEGDMIDSFDVVYWLLEQTCSGIEQLLPLYYSQGMDFCRRTQACLDNSAFLANTKQREAYLNSLRQIEQQSLAQLYGVSARKKPVKALASTSPQILPFMNELDSRRKAFQDSGEAVHASALQEVEQEREVAYEVEAVREVQKPVHYTALGFPTIHKDVLNFVKTGKLTVDSAGYELAFDALGRTLLGTKYKVHTKGTSSKLFVSTEFTRTVKFPGRPYDHFQRPVNWILWSTVSQAALIIIPEEAEILLPMIGSTRDSPTYLLTYAAPVTRKMLHFSDLSFYSVPTLPAGWQAPTWLKVELGIYAGRLYFDFSEYDALLEFLGIRHTSAGHVEIGPDEDEQLDDTFVQTSVEHAKVFTRKPLTFLQEWLAIRRKGQNFDQTPMGFVCQGKVLLESHHFFSKVASSAGVKGGELKVDRSGGSKDVEDVEKDFCDEEAQGEILRPEDLEDFDESKLDTGDNVLAEEDEAGEDK